MRVSAIIVAAGKGSRMNTNINKQYLMLSNKPVLVHTIEAFEKSEIISEIIVVIHEEDQKLFEACITPYRFKKITGVVNGGADRQASVYHGLQKVNPDSGIISVHDGARPLITPAIIADSIAVATSKGAACVGVPVKDTIKRVHPDKIVDETLDRSLLWVIQTPQVFSKEILVKIHDTAITEGYRGTDDSVLAERQGIPVHMVMGSYTNIKITTYEDLVFAKTFLQLPGSRQREPSP